MSFGNYYEAYKIAKLRMAEIEKEAELRRLVNEAHRQGMHKKKEHRHWFSKRPDKKGRKKGRGCTSDLVREIGIEADNPLTYTGF